MSRKPLAIDLYAGLGGWAEGLLAEGWRVVGFDIERHDYGRGGYPGELVLQDVLTLDGRQFGDASLIVASPPCQEFSYMAMPWTRGKQIAAALRGRGEFPDGYTGSRNVAELKALFDACFRLQREASIARGEHISTVIENVKGAEAWVGRAKWHFGSFYLWGDVPALMPRAMTRAMKRNPDGTDHGQGSWFAVDDSKQRGAKVTGFRFDGSGRSFQSASVEGVKQGGSGAAWFDGEISSMGSRSNSRKAASAEIAKIPLALASWIGRCYYPCELRAEDREGSDIEAIAT